MASVLVSAYSEAGYNVVANALSIEPSSNPSIINVPGDIGKPETADRIMCVPSICRSAWQSSRSDSIVFAPNSIAAITHTDILSVRPDLLIWNCYTILLYCLQNILQL